MRVHGALGWRFAALGGCATGLALAPAAPAGASARLPALACALSALAALAARPREAPRWRAPAAWLACVAVAGALGGLAAGALRLAAIDAGAFRAAPGARVALTGYLAATPRRSAGRVRLRLDTADGRIAVEAPEPVPDLAIGSRLRAVGTLRRAEPGFEAAYLARYGIAEVLDARRLAALPGARGGLPGLADAVRTRAAAALGRGTEPAEAALLRGFVLGQDDRIEPETAEDFKRAGLAHLLAVSGDCVMLLTLLGSAILAALGVPLRARMLALLALIAIYVPVAGGGPSIQRAGIMGAAGIVALLAGRPRFGWYALLLAALGTLAINPRAAGDPSWQLSFAAVAGILTLARPVASLLRGPGPSPVRRALAEGAGVTVAATVATAPLFAHHFGAVSLAALPANLLALPAVPPMMWLAMLAGIAGQVPGLPVEPLTFLAGLLAAYVAQVAHWLAAPGWAQARVSLPGWGQVAAAYAGLAAAAALALRWLGRRRGTAPRRPPLAALAAAAAAAALWLLAPGGAALPDPGLRVVVLDVGQGDSILLDPRAGPAVLVDAGPPGDDIAAHLGRLGVRRLAAVVVTHDQSDHDGGLPELLAALRVRRLVYAAPARGPLRVARAAGVPTAQVAEGSELRSGALRLEVLWPPRDRISAPPPGADPNLLAIVAIARWHRFAMLLTADAEAESVPYDPGPVDVLKVAHHGSEDAGLDSLLDRAAPALAVISVGSPNPYGHPAPPTLATLAAHAVPVLRTDEGGDVELDVDRGGFTVRRPQ